MRPLTDHTPKPLLKVGGKPLIVWHIENLSRAGFKEIVINHAYLGAQIEAYLGDGSQWGVSIQYSPESSALETAGGIANALALLDDGSGDRLLASVQNNTPFLVVNGDIFTDIDFSLLKEALLLARSTATATATTKLAHLVMIDNPAQHPNGDFLYVNGRLIAGNEAGDTSEHKSAHKLTFSGIGVYHPALFNGVVRGQTAKLAPILKQAIANGLVTATHYQGVWHDVGTPERLAELDALY